MKKILKVIWNILIYFSPIFFSWGIWQFSSLDTIVKFDDTNFTVSWSISTLAAGLVLSNLPQDNKWVFRIKKTPGLFVRLSLFLMSPTIYGLTHYVLSQTKNPNEVVLRFMFITYAATILSIILSLLFFGIICYKLHDEN